MPQNSIYSHILPDFSIGDIDCENFKVRYVEKGLGPPMVFLHNGGADLSVWREQLRYFSATHRVIAFDFLGFGESGRPDGPHDLELFYKALQALLNVLKIENPILIGNCVGASTAIEYALRNPEKIKKLVLCSICGGASFVPAANLIRFIPGIAYAKSWLSVQKFFLSSDYLFSKKVPSELRKHYEEIIFKRHDLRATRTKTLQGTLSFTKFGRSLNLPQKFPETMIVWGTENKIMHVKYAQISKELLKAKVLKIISGGSYLCFYENYHEFNQSVQTFIE